MLKRKAKALVSTDCHKNLILTIEFIYQDSCELVDLHYTQMVETARKFNLELGWDSTLDVWKLQEPVAVVHAMEAAAPAAVVDRP